MQSIKRSSNCLIASFNGLQLTWHKCEAKSIPSGIPFWLSTLFYSDFIDLKVFISNFFNVNLSSEPVSRWEWECIREKFYINSKILEKKKHAKSTSFNSNDTLLPSNLPWKVELSPHSTTIYGYGLVTHYNTFHSRRTLCWCEWLAA